MFPSLSARETCVAETTFATRKRKLFLPEVKNIVASRTQMLFSKHLFPSVATMKTMLTRFQCCSLKMFHSNVTQTTKVVKVWKDEERESYSFFL